MRRLLVIALDGAGFPLLDPWINAGKLPHLALAMNNGTHGDLMSTIPPLTGPAWASFQTGVNPGKHGVSSWTKFTPGGKISVVTGADIPYPTLWELVSEAGRRVISIGLPLTYPPRKVTGVIIPGLLTPLSDPSPTYPPQAYAELRRVVPRYRFFPECAHRFTVRSKTNELLASVRARGGAAKHFLHRYNWDLAMVHFQATDKVQHDLWGAHKCGFDPLLSVFQEVDRQVGELSEIARGMGASVLILSDHGMGQQQYTFSVNTWLLNNGYLKLKHGVGTRIRRVLFHLGLSQRRLARLGFLLYPLAYRLGLVRSFFDTVGDGFVARLIATFFLSLDDIDWSCTHAYSHCDVGHIRLQRQGMKDSEAERLIDELIDRLKKVVNQRSKEPLLGKVFRREEIYHGDKLAEAPEILFLPRGLRTLGSGASGFYSNILLDRPLLRAHHRMEGILIASGEPFRNDYTIANACLTDVAANILYLLDCPVPRYMDGKLWEEAYQPEFISQQPLRRSDRPPTRNGGKKTNQDIVAAELRQRLKELGYLS